MTTNVPDGPTTLAAVASRRIKELRIDRGWSQGEVAKRLRLGSGLDGWAATQVAKAERGEYRLDRLPDLVAFCEVFRVSLDDLMGGDDTVRLGRSDSHAGRRELSSIRLVMKGKGRANNEDILAADDPYDIDRIVKLAGLEDEEQLQKMCEQLWQNDSFLSVRDYKAGLRVRDIPNLDPVTVARRRGASTKRLLAEIREALDTFGYENFTNPENWLESE